MFKNVIPFFGVLLLTLCVSLSAHSQVVLPSVFSDHMVLQRNAEVNLWGWGQRGSQLMIIPSWSADTIKLTCDGHARWATTLQTPEAGGPYEITFINRNTTTSLKDILIGEVWLCSGQSNMEWGAQNKLQEMLDEIGKPVNDQIRLLHVNRIGSDQPQENFVNTWEYANEERLKEFSAIGYFIAHKLNAELDVPIGIISASIGGTNAEVWMPREAIERDEILLADANTYKVHASRPTNIAAAWNGMLHPLKGFTLAGFYWYQGEANIGKHKNYNRLMTALVNSWRMEWDAELPFYYVQIAPYNYKSPATEQRAALLREQQVDLLQLPKTGMVVASDLVPDISNIHPPYKRAVANRLADLALAETYGHTLRDYKSPVYKSHTVKGNQIIVEFDYVEGGLMIKGNEIGELSIAGADGVYSPATGKIDGNKLIISSKSVKEPKSVLFSFTDTGIGNLFTKTGLPVAPFRISL